VASRVVSELLAVVVPPACIACRTPLVRADLRLCAACTRALPWLPARACRRCGLPSHRRGCPAAGAAFARAWAPLAHDGVARQLVAALKFRGALPVAGLMAAHVAANLPPDLRGGAPAAVVPAVQRDSGPAAVVPAVQRNSGPAAFVPVVPRGGDPAAVVPAVQLGGDPVALVPVPPQAARRRRRGFDPAAALAAGLAPRLGLGISACLRRRDRESRQVGSTRAQRRRAGRLVIELRAPPPARALLIDDVHTTGATLDACARALLAGGCEEVIAVTYTRTL
jgi:predicted amidophosphoribosyltransferase